jgi:peptide/nickel transport system permease protein
MPGDSVLMLTGMDEKTVSREEYEYYREKTGADKPLPQQFAAYIAGIIKGDLGFSYQHNRSVRELIGARIPATLLLALPALLLSSFIALALGSYAGMKRGKVSESIISALQIIADAFPGFLLGLLFIRLFSFQLKWFPSGALSSVIVPKGVLPQFADRFLHLVLPVCVLVIGSVPGKYLLTLSLVAKERDEKYTVYARSRGIDGVQLLWSHILPNIVQPYIAMVGINFGFVLSGSLIIENIFSIRGIGTLMSAAIEARDYPLLQGCLLISAVTVVVSTIISDIVCVAIDPKVRLKTHEIN